MKVNGHALERKNRHTRAQNKHTHKLQQTSRHKQTNTMAAQQQIAYSMTQGGVPVGITEGVQARFEVDDAHVGFIIGKKGGNVKRIRDQTKCQILIQDPDEKSDGKKWFLVRGLFKKNVANALAELAMMANRAPVANRGYGVPSQEEYEPSMVKCSYLVVHPDHVGIIVGKRGANVTRISREHGAFVYIQKPCVQSGGMPWFQIKGLYERNIEAAYFALVQEAQRAEQTLPRFTVKPQFAGPTPEAQVKDAEVKPGDDWGEEFPPYKHEPRPMPVMPSEDKRPVSRELGADAYPPAGPEPTEGDMDAVIDFVAKHKDGDKFPKEDPVGAAFCLANGISAEDCVKIREAARAQVAEQQKRFEETGSYW
jgi:hypothetical protein